MFSDTSMLTAGQLLRLIYQGHANGWLEGTADQPAGPLWEVVAADFLAAYLERTQEQGERADAAD